MRTLTKHFTLIDKPSKKHYFTLIRAWNLGLEGTAILCSDLKNCLGYTGNRVLGISTVKPQELNVFSKNKNYYLPIKYLKRYFETVAKTARSKEKKELATQILENNIPDYLLEHSIINKSLFLRDGSRFVLEADLLNYYRLQNLQKDNTVYYQKDRKWVKKDNDVLLSKNLEVLQKTNPILEKEITENIFQKRIESKPEKRKKKRRSKRKVF